MKKINFNLLIYLFFFLTLISCNEENEKNVNKISLDADSKNSFEKEIITEVEEKAPSNNLFFSVPPPTGPGSGVCSVNLVIRNSTIEGTESCGGHDEMGHTESSETIFKVKFIKNHKYKVSDLLKNGSGGSIGCEYFEIASNKLYLYDENLNIINDAYCQWGNTVNPINDNETCDCVFFPSPNQ